MPKSPAKKAASTKRSKSPARNKSGAQFRAPVELKQRPKGHWVPCLMWFVRFPFFLGWFLLVCAYGCLLCIFKPGHEKNNEKICKAYGAVAVWLAGCKLHHLDWHKVPKNKAAVYICNHQSALDLMCCATDVPPGVVCVAKESLRFVPFLGWFWSRTGNLFIDRKDRSSAVSKLSTVEQRLESNKNSVWVFPEGTRNKTNPGEVLPFKKGAFHMAVNAQVPIVPMIISNIWRVCDPFGDGWHWRGGDLYIQCLDPIPTKGKTTADIDALIGEAYTTMADALDAMEAKAEKADKKSAQSKKNK